MAKDNTTRVPDVAPLGADGPVVNAQAVLKERTFYLVHLTLRKTRAESIT